MSAQFESCREAIVEVLSIVKDICRVLYYRVSEWVWSGVSGCGLVE